MLPFIPEDLHHPQNDLHLNIKETSLCFFDLKDQHFYLKSPSQDKILNWSQHLLSSQLVSSKIYLNAILQSPSVPPELYFRITR